jgi:hypothetical protein
MNEMRRNDAACSANAGTKKIYCFSEKGFKRLFLITLSFDLAVVFFF